MIKKKHMKYSRIILLVSGIFAFSFTSNFQNNSPECNTYFPLTVGMQWTTKNMDKKGKETGRSTIKVLDTKPADDGLIYVMQGILNFEGKEETHETNFEYQCSNNALKMDMDQFIPTEMLENESMTFDVDTDGMMLPENLRVGQKLNDASVQIVGKIEEMKVIDMKVTVFDRMIEKFEDITTEAGTFNCAKLTSKTTMKMAFMNSTSSSIQWINNKVGIVKTEEYDKKGKLESSSELVEFTK
jgi:hypothetical protein